MAYFPAAYKKVFVVSDGHNTTGPMEEMTPGMMGFFDAKTWAPIDVSGATMAAHPQVVLVLANPYHTPGADKQGPYGGFTESVKSQIIDPRYVSRVWKVHSRSGRPQVVFLGWDGEDYNLNPEFTCGKTYHLRLDLKGASQLRFVGHNLSRRFAVTTPCCKNVVSPEKVDAVSVLLELARQIMADPMISPFVSASVITEDMDGNLVTADPATYVPATTPEDLANVVAGLQIWVNQADTLFLNCSVEWNDYIQLEQSMITGAQLINEDGKPCGDFKELPFTEKLTPLAAEGTPALILRDVLQFLAYQQEVFPVDRRMQYVKDLRRVMSRITATLLYTSYYILHQVPRHYNPTGVHDEDQYLIQLVFPAGDSGSMTFLENWLQSYLSSAGNNMAMEDFSGEPDGT